ncbi:hypothetical protein FKM82_018705 [Ascaphus truei]
MAGSACVNPHSHGLACELHTPKFYCFSFQAKARVCCVITDPLGERACSVLVVLLLREWELNSALPPLEGRVFRIAWGPQAPGMTSPVLLREGMISVVWEPCQKGQAMQRRKCYVLLLSQ